MSTTIALANRKSAIRLEKKKASLTSITPRFIALKWVRKLKERIASVNQSGAQPAKKLRTTAVPLTVKRNATAAVTTKAMTWFLVVAEIQAPIARMPPAISRLPA